MGRSTAFLHPVRGAPPGGIPLAAIEFAHLAYKGNKSYKRELTSRCLIGFENDENFVFLGP